MARERCVRVVEIVVGEVGKQSSIFTRTLKHIVFRPMWRVPESIKVRELWPSMLRGGGLMKQYGLELETKDGKPLNWRTMDWTLSIAGHGAERAQSEPDRAVRVWVQAGWAF